MRSGMVQFLVAVCVFCTAAPASGQADKLQPLHLPAAQTDGGAPLMQALRQRHTTREMKTEKLPPQVMANLLWAAFGINRTQTGQRTAPSAMNSQEVDVYAAQIG